MTIVRLRLRINWLPLAVIAQLAGLLVVVSPAPTFAAHVRTSCWTFLDNRSLGAAKGRLVIHARQREPVDLYAHYIDPEGHVDNAVTTARFAWRVLPDGATIVADPLRNGHATFYGGLLQHVYGVAVTASGPDGTACREAEITMDVDLDFEGWISVGPEAGPIFDEFSPGSNSITTIGHFQAGREFSQFSLPLFVGVDVDRSAFVHNSDRPLGSCPAPDPGCVTVLASIDASGMAHFTQQYIPSRQFAQNTTQLRFGVKALDPRIFFEASLLNRSLDFASYGHLRGLGVGSVKLPDLDRSVSLFGDLTFYPHAEAQYRAAAGQSVEVQYRLLTYQFGIAHTYFYGHLFAELGYQGDRGFVRYNAPGDFSTTRTFIGVGVHF